MGWTYYQATYYKRNNKIDRLAECRAEFGKQPSWATILKDSIVDNVYYAAMKSTDSNEIWALVVLTDTGGSEFGYKDMDETMGPGYYDCPVGILKLLSPTDNAYAKEWRKNCYAAIEQKRKGQKLARLLDTAKTIRVTLPDTFQGKYYQPGETVELSRYTNGRWVDWTKRVAFHKKSVIEYGFTVIE